MRFGVLGPLVVSAPNGEVAFGAAKPRALLVRLLVDPNRVVAVDRLVEDLWDGSPPRSAGQTLQTYVSQLRKVLGADRVVTVGGGYRIVVEPAELDTERFEAAAAEGHAALTRGSWPEAEERFRQALAEWRGDALIDVAGAAWALAESARLEELRLSAIESLFEAQLAVGKSSEVVVAAETAVADNPLRERLWAHLITAYYRVGRQADALRAYQRLRERLADELGIDPSPELRDLEAAVLQQTVVGAPPSRPQLGLPTGVVSFVLTDVVGSTPLWEAAPEDMVDALARHDAIVRSSVATYSGVFLKSRGEGDSTFSVFQRATDAVSAARALLDNLAAEPWPERAPIRVRAAIHTGEAVERDGDYYGRAVNRVARLRELAGAEQVVLSQATAELVRDHLPDDCSLVEQGTQELRGIQRPETIYRLAVAIHSKPQETHEDVVPLPRRLAGGQAFGFVGRTTELETLAQWQKETAGSQRHVALVSGEPGIGKTSLVFEAARAAYSSGAIVLLGRCDEDIGVPYQPWIEALGHLASHVPDSVLDDVGARRLADLSRLVPEVSERRRHLTPPARGDAETDRYLFYSAVVATLEAAAALAPIVVLVDDLHWADTGSLVLLRHVVGALDRSRILLLATYRDSELSQDHPLTDTLAMLRREEGVHRMALRGIDDSDVVAYIEAAAGHRLGESGIALARAVHRETDGNPFFAREMLRHLAETGAVSRTDQGKWETGIEFDEADLPESIREVVGRRVSRHGDEVRNALSVAAVIGRDFDLDVLSGAIGADEDELLVVLERAEAAGLVTSAGRSRSSFAHVLIQHALVADLSPARLARTHRIVAEAIEATGRIEGHTAELAHHWAAATAPGDAGRAVEYARRAGDEARIRLAPDEAIRWYMQALELIGAGDDQTRCDLLVRLGRAQRDADDGSFGSTLLEAGELARRIGDDRNLVRAALASATGYSMGETANPARIALLESALGVEGLDDGVRARLLATLAVELVFLDQKERRTAVSDEAVAVARRSGNAATLIQVLSNWYFANWTPETLEKRLAVSAEAVQLADELDVPALRFWARLFRFTACIENFDVDQAAEVSDVMTALTAESGQPRQRRNNLMYRTMLLLIRGDLAAAELCVSELRGLTKPGGEGSQLVSAASCLAWYRGDLQGVIAEREIIPEYSPALALLATLELGQIDLARQELEAEYSRGLWATHPLGPVGQVALSAEVAARLGDVTICQSLYDDLSPHAERTAFDGVSLSGMVAHALGVLSDALGRLDDADQYFATAAAGNERMAAPFLMARTCVAWARMLLRRDDRGDRDRARDLLGRGHDLAARYGCAGVERAAADLLASSRD